MTFDEFLRAEMPGLARFAGALTGDPHLGEDILSDALLIVSTKWRRISGMQHPVSYVRRIVVNVFLSERRKSRRRRTETTADLHLLDRAGDNPHEAVDSRDAIERLLTGLTAKQRAAVVLRYVFDQTDDDIADVLDCSAGTVRSHLSHARAILRLAAVPAE